MEVEVEDATRRGPRRIARWIAALCWGAVNVAAAVGILLGVPSPEWETVLNGQVLLRNDGERAHVVVPIARFGEDDVQRRGARSGPQPYPQRPSLARFGLARELPSARLEPGEVVHFLGREHGPFLDAILVERANGSWARFATTGNLLDAGDDEPRAIPDPTTLPDASADELALLESHSRALRPTWMTLLAVAPLVTIVRLLHVAARRTGGRWWLRPTWRELLTTPIAFGGFVVVLSA